MRLDLLSILIVEDVAPMRQLLMAILSALGVGTILSAASGDEGFDIFCNETPDIVITDWHMEPGDGIELTQKIRTSPLSPNKTAPVIMLTGFSALKKIEQSRDAGVTEYLSKPFTAEKLIKRITHVIENPRDFILTASYFGPDRRRRELTGYSGPYRRAADTSVDMNDVVLVG